MSRKVTTFIQKLRNYFREYCSCTSIHGFRYFGEKRTIFERIWWILIFCITLALCGYSIHAVYWKWKTSPVLVSFATRETRIYNIPFPAVTICPEAKSHRPLFNFAETFKKHVANENLTEKEDRLFEYLSMICDTRMANNVSQNDYLDEDFYDTLMEIHDFDVISNMFFCEFMGITIPCYKIFKPIFTDEGYCVTFNMLNLADIYRDNILHHDMHYSDFYEEKETNWSVQDGYPKEAGMEIFPKRALFAGAKNSLTVFLVTFKTNTDPVCKLGFHGYRVVIHTPMRIPLTSQHYFRIPLNQELLGSIQPVMMETSDRIKMYDPKIRECYFPSERNLTYFKIYTQVNCRIECLAKYTLMKCGCVLFYMPRENGTKICGGAMKKCTVDAQKYLQTANLEQELNEDYYKNNASSSGAEFCDCLPTCTDISYEVDISQSEWDWLQMFISMDSNATFELGNIAHFSKLTLFFKYSQFVTSKRHELYGPTDFLANFGGLLGLFTGFSALSLMEILYFATVRIVCNKKLYGVWYGPAN